MQSSGFRVLYSSLAYDRSRHLAGNRNLPKLRNVSFGHLRDLRARRDLRELRDLTHGLAALALRNIIGMISSMHAPPLFPLSPKNFKNQTWRWRLSYLLMRWYLVELSTLSLVIVDKGQGRKDAGHVILSHMTRLEGGVSMLACNRGTS